MTPASKEELLERAIEAAEEQTGSELDEHGNALVESIVDELWSMLSETDGDLVDEEYDLGL